MEHLIEISHAEEKYRIGVLRLDFGVLVKHRSLCHVKLHHCLRCAWAMAVRRGCISNPVLPSLRDGIVESLNLAYANC